MSAPNSTGTDIHSEAFLHSLMRRQLKLSIACAGTFLLVLLGLPLVLTRNARNIYWAAAMGGGIAMVVFFTTMTCQGLGSNYLLDPVLAAWIPLVLFGPLSFTLARPLWD